MRRGSATGKAFPHQDKLLNFVGMTRVMSCINVPEVWNLG
jgi:hypothetical protein